MTDVLIRGQERQKHTPSKDSHVTTETKIGALLLQAMEHQEVEARKDPPLQVSLGMRPC